VFFVVRNKCTNNILHLIHFFEALKQVPILNHELQMVSSSNVMRHFRTRHVGASHDGNQHVQQMHDHHEGRNYENEDQREGGPLISQEEAVVVEFSKSQKPHVPE
jgi:hypothetical protein